MSTMKEITDKKLDAFIAMTDAFITTSSAALDPIDFQRDYKLMTILSFHFGVFSVVGSFLNMDEGQLRMAMYRFFYSKEGKNAQEASYIVNQMFELGKTDIGKDLMQHGAFALDDFINGKETAALVLKEILEGSIEADAHLDRMKEMDIEDDSDNEWFDEDEEWF